MDPPGQLYAVVNGPLPGGGGGGAGVTFAIFVTFRGGGGSIFNGEKLTGTVHFQSHTCAYKGLTVVVCHRGLVYWKSTDLSDRSYKCKIASVKTA